MNFRQPTLFIFEESIEFKDKLLDSTSTYGVNEQLYPYLQ